MRIRRVVPNLPCLNVEATRDFYVGLVGIEVAMDMGWIVTVASPDNSTAQGSLLQGEAQPTGDDPFLTSEVDDVDAVHDAALAAGHDVVLTLRDEPWRVRRFFTRDPDGRVINVMTQPSVAG